MAPRHIHIPGSISVNDEPKLYFSNQNISVLVDGLKRDAEQDVQSIDADVLLNTPVDDIVESIVEKRSIDVPRFRRDDAYMLDPIETKVPMRDYGRVVEPEGTLLVLIVPFDGEAGLFWYRPTTFNTAPPRGNLHNNNMILKLKGANLNSDAVKKHFDRVLDEFDQYLNWLRPSAEGLKTELKQRMHRSVEARQSRLLADRNLVANLPYKMHARSGASQTYAAPVKRKPLITQRTSAEKFKPEPVLVEADYQHVLTVIEGMTKTMERSPATFAKLDEEQLRDMYLVPLNGHFEGAASGETFNAAGKTDILIRVDDRNVFIAECKIWRGQKYLTEAIDQLFTYLTWRDTKAAVIIFNRNKDFSSVLESIKATVASHPNKKQGPKIEGETRFRYVFGHPNDQNREIFMTILSFDVPV